MPKDTSNKTSVSASSKKASKPTPVASSSSSKPSKASSSKAQPLKASTDFDIDDIFAASSSSAALQPPLAATTSSKKKKKAKKPAAVEDEDTPVVEVSRVQTVVDPSIGVGKKIEPPAGGVGEIDGDMEAFRNSRGSGSESTGSTLA
jgi:hypothetical protein